MKNTKLSEDSKSAPLSGTPRGRDKSGHSAFNHWLFQTMAHGQRAERGEVRYLILDALSDKTRHGYDIIREIATRSEEVYSPSTGVVYPTLHMLEKSGFVRAYEENGTKLFCITDEGRQELEKNRKEVEDAYARLCGHMPVLRGEDFKAIGKQVDRILKSLKKAFQRGQMAPDKVGTICASLEEAAGRIEKILKDKKH